MSAPLGFHRRRGAIPHGFYLPALRCLEPFAARRFIVALMIVARPRSRNEALTAATSERAGFYHSWLSNRPRAVVLRAGRGINTLPYYAAGVSEPSISRLETLNQLGPLESDGRGDGRWRCSGRGFTTLISPSCPPWAIYICHSSLQATEQI